MKKKYKLNEQKILKIQKLFIAQEAKQTTIEPHARLDLSSLVEKIEEILSRINYITFGIMDSIMHHEIIVMLTESTIKSFKMLSNQECMAENILKFYEKISEYLELIDTIKIKQESCTILLQEIEYGKENRDVFLADDEVKIIATYDELKQRCKTLRENAADDNFNANFHNLKSRLGELIASSQPEQTDKTIMHNLMWDGIIRQETIRLEDATKQNVVAKPTKKPFL